MPPQTVRVDIVSDVVCPWCYIGYRQLQRAVAMLQDRFELAVRWHPFMLAPDLPPEGRPIADHVRERYGANPEQSAANRTRLREVATGLGIDLRLGADARIYNTEKAHRLLTWAGEAGGQTSLKLALFDTYFTRGESLGDDQVLIAAAERAGLDREAATAALAEPRYARMVAEQVAWWQDQNVTGVPAFVFDGGYMVPGAQEAETFVRVIERVAERAAA